MDEFDFAFGGGVRRVRAGLGVTSFGMQVVELPPNFGAYPEHDHSHDDQEEVYVPLSGKVTLRVGGADHELEPGVFARVGPGERRKLITGEQGVRLLCVGGQPGQPYTAPDWSEEGAAVSHKVGKHEVDEQQIVDHAVAEGHSPSDDKVRR